MNREIPAYVVLFVVVLLLMAGVSLGILAICHIGPDPFPCIHECNESNGAYFKSHRAECLQTCVDEEKKKQESGE